MNWHVFPQSQLVQRARTLALFFFLSLVSSLSFATSITYHGRLIKPNGDPVTGTHVEFRVQIRTPGSGNCLLYQETHSKDLSVSNGVFSLGINDGTAIIANVEPFSLDRVFQNRGVFQFGAGKCVLGSDYTPNTADGRNIVVDFNDGSFAGWESLPTQAINHVPMAIEAMTVAGFSSKQLLRVVDGSGDPANIGALTTTQHSALMDLILGTSTSYLGSSSALAGGNLVNGSVTDAKLATGISGSKISGNISGDAAGFTGALAGDVTGPQGATVVTRLQGRNVDTATPGNGQVLKWSNSNSRWEPSNDLNDGAVSSVTGTLPVVVTAGANPVVSVNDGSTASKGVLQLALSGESNAAKAVKADDSRLSDARTPTAHTHTYAQLDNAASVYMTYRPNNVACANGETLKWANGPSRWECGTDLSGSSSPLLAKGDIFVHNGTSNIALAVGTNGQVLRADSGAASGLSWSDNVATDLGSLATTGIVQRNGAASYSTVVVASPLSYSGGTLGVSAGSGGVVMEGGNTVTSAMTIGANSAHSLGLKTSGQPRLTIDSAGLVGIGTASPASLLDVAGTIRAQELCDETGANCRDLSTAITGGTVTNIATGIGLTGGPITATGTIGIAAGGVSATELASDAVTTAKILDANITGAKLETVSGLVAGAYGSASAIPSVTVDVKGRVMAITTNAITGLLPTATGVGGKYLKSDGTSWAAQDVRFSDIKNSTGTSAFNIGACLANQTVAWSSLTDMFSCQNIGSLDAGAMTTGTLALGLLPSSVTAGLWAESSGNVSRTTGTVGVGTATPHASALLDVTSTSKGFLPPRMTTAQRIGVSSPADGLIVFDTDTSNLYVYRSSAWVKLADTTDVSFHVTKTSAQSLGTGTYDKIDWQTVVYDTKSAFNLATDRFQPNVPGKYLITFKASSVTTPTSGYWHTIISKNGVSQAVDWQPWGSGMQLMSQVTTIVELNGTTDYVEFSINSTAASQTVAQHPASTMAQGFLISGGTGGGGGGSADHLGNHVATQNIALVNNWLSSDGDNEGVRVASDGKVGIGTATPNSLLDVAGTIRATTLCDSNGSNCKNIADGWTGTANTSMAPNWADAIECNYNTARIILHRTAYWNGATASPQVRYSYAPDPSNYFVEYSYTGALSAKGPSITASVYSDCDNEAYSVVAASGRTHNFIGGGDTWSRGSSSQVTYMAGSVGIGTLTPADLLHVQGSVASGNLSARVENTNATGYSTLWLGSASNYASIWKNGSSQTSYAGANSFNLGTTAAYPIGFVTNNAVQMTLTSAGKLGLGTSSPSRLLHVNQNVNSDYVAQMSNGGGAGNGLYINAGSTNSTSSYPLVVADYAGTSLFYVRGDGGYYHSGAALSTKESKMNIQPMSENALGLLKDIEVVTYKYKMDPADRPDRIGFIANDDDHVYDARLTNDKKGFDTNSILGTVIKALQEIYAQILGHQDQIATHDREIASLKAENAQMKAENEKLQKRLERLEQALPK